MKLNILSFLLLHLMFVSVSGQVGINISNPDPSSALDVVSIDKGVLVPRMDSSQRVSIVSPAVGLLVYQTDSKKGFYYFDGSSWKSVATNASNTSPQRYIGENYGGGVIFHLWKDGSGVEHGLIVSTTNQNNFIPWGNITNASAGATSTWNGLSNSNAIVSQPGHDWSAAEICLDLVDGGQTDWYLPSIDELGLLWHNRFQVNQTLSNISGATLLPAAVDYFWSSTERSATEGWIFSFYGYSYHPTKDSNCFVRAIRSF